MSKVIFRLSTFFSTFWFLTFWSFDVLIILKILSTFWPFDVLIFDFTTPSHSNRAFRDLGFVIHGLNSTFWSLDLWSRLEPNPHFYESYNPRKIYTSLFYLEDSPDDDFTAWRRGQRSVVPVEKSQKCRKERNIVKNKLTFSINIFNMVKAN